MNTEKSVVEQAADALRLWNNAWNEFDKTGKNKPETFEEVIAPFIEMEKEQICNAWNDGQSDGATICTQKADNPSEEYYNKTFKSE